MRASDRFVDTNVLLYLLSGDDTKANQAEEVLSHGGVISVQVLNEFASIAIKKFKLSVSEVREILTTVRAVFGVHALTEDTHDLGFRLMEKYRLSLYDAMIVAAALMAGCTTLLSQDMRHGQMIDGRIRILDPFR